MTAGLRRLAPLPFTSAAAVASTSAGACRLSLPPPPACAPRAYNQGWSWLALICRPVPLPQPSYSSMKSTLWDASGAWSPSVLVSQKHEGLIRAGRACFTAHRHGRGKRHKLPHRAAVAALVLSGMLSLSVVPCCSDGAVAVAGRSFHPPTLRKTLTTHPPSHPPISPFDPTAAAPRATTSATRRSTRCCRRWTALTTRPRCGWLECCNSVLLHVVATASDAPFEQPLTRKHSRDFFRPPTPQPAPFRQLLQSNRAPGLQAIALTAPPTAAASWTLSAC